MKIITTGKHSVGLQSISRFGSLSTLTCNLIVILKHFSSPFCFNFFFISFFSPSFFTLFVWNFHLLKTSLIEVGQTLIHFHSKPKGVISSTLISSAFISSLFHCFHRQKWKKNSETKIWCTFLLLQIQFSPIVANFHIEREITEKSQSAQHVHHA